MTAPDLDELARLLEEATLDLGELERLVGEATTVADSYPPRHARYVVLRDDLWFTATPCYGMHAPWWVVRTMADSYPSKEAEPVGMRDTDRWFPIAAFAAAINALPALLATARRERRMREALERLEWDGWRYGTPCPACQRDQQDGHSDECWLAAALAEEGQDVE